MDKLFFIDYIIVVAYLILITLYGLSVSNTIKTLDDFAVSDKKYGSFVIFATLFASFIGGGFSTGNASKTYQTGIGYSIALTGFSIKEILIGKYISPHMQKHKDVISTAGIIKKAYGKEAALFTGILSVLLCGGMLGAQIGTMGYIFSEFAGFNRFLGIFIGCTIVVVYSTTGGMKAVVATDVAQFLILFLGIPLTLFFSLKSAGGFNTLISNSPCEYFDIFNEIGFWGFTGLFFTFMFGEALIPPYTQRLLIAKDTNSLKKASILSGIISIPFFIIIGLCGIVAFISFPNIDPNSAFPKLVNNLPTIIRGFVMAGFISIVMSSADSILNSASVSFVNDILSNLKKPNAKNLLKSARLANVITAFIAIITAIVIPNVIDILILFYTLWAPCMLVPLVFAIVGRKRNKRCFFRCITIGLLSSLLLKYLLKPPFEFSYLAISIILSLITYLVYPYKK